MSRRAWLAQVLVSALLTMLPLMYSTLPDQNWMGGFYDGGDEDDALAHLQLKLSGTESVGIDASSPLEVVASPPLAHERSESLRVPLSTQTRAPPTL
jgi:hypothetical protein